MGERHRFANARISLPERIKMNGVASKITAKLEVLLYTGIKTEADAIQFVVLIRKLLEDQHAKKQYEYLTFYCDWAYFPHDCGGIAPQRYSSSCSRISSGRLAISSALYCSSSPIRSMA